MVIEDELQALLLLSSLLNSWETLVVSVSNSAPDGKLSMGQVSSSLFNEETRRKLVGTDNAQALVSENRGRSKNRGQKGRGKSKGRSQSRGKSTERGKCYHCEEECLHVGNETEWVVDTGASYHATYNKQFFTSYKAGDFGTVKMGNISHSNIVGIGDVCIRTSVGCTMTLRDVRHVPDLRLNLISGIALDREGYINYFGNGIWKLTKGSLVVAKGKACCALYKTSLKACKDGLNFIEDGISPNLWHKRLGHMSEKGLPILAKKSFIPFAKDGGEVQEEPTRDETPLMTDDMLESDNEVGCLRVLLLFGLGDSPTGRSPTASPTGRSPAASRSCAATSCPVASLSPCCSMTASSTVLSSSHTSLSSLSSSISFQCSSVTRPF
ncbi:hypothetical protein F0562_001949 [Nyssa sinensis]|uniref:GAG-pre-integrase domain-containing protein n=1 Tax=Nyssa sinensis TaxID=561372 RepID=A0A5J5C4L0_9ASTE|nr:hypothetical protein F0562_001949 [Nyssa sinensis]